MNMTEEQLQAILQKNPALKVKHQAGRPSAFLQNMQTGSAESKKEPKAPKYRNQKVYVYQNGMALYEKNEKLGKSVEVFDSVKEYNRWQELKLLQKAGQISDLTRQKELVIQEAFDYMGTRIQKISYKADFSYQLRDGGDVVEDVKGYDEATEKYLTTAEFRLKWKLLKCKYPHILFLLK